MTNTKPKFGVFLALTFSDKIYKDYPDVSQDVRDLEVPNLIITLREDGFFGFLGGSANEGETELQCLTREVKEEGNIDLAWLLSFTRPEHFNRVCEHVLHDDYKVVLYHINITKHIAKMVIKQSVDAPHFFTETAGLNSVAIHPKSSFYKNAFLSCAQEEFKAIAEIINSEILNKWGQLIKT